MSRFIEQSATRAITAPCGCPGTPHPEDRVEIVAEVPYGVVGQVSAAGYADNPAVFNRIRANQKLLELTVRSWNFLGPDGREWPVTPVSIALLDASTLEWISKEVNRGFKPAKIPKGLPEHSANGSSGMPSRTPATAGTATSPSSTTSS